MNTFDKIEKLEVDFDNSIPDFHAVFSVQICELIYDGIFDLSRDDWDFSPKYSPKQHTTLCEKITNHYYYREISMTPPGIWKREFLRKMNEIMPKYMPMYELLDKYPELFNASGEYYKGRNIFSDFPQTRLQSSNQDYASTGNDTEYERIFNLSVLDMYKKMMELGYKDVDSMIIDEIETLFYPMFTANYNAF